MKKEKDFMNQVSALYDKTLEIEKAIALLPEQSAPVYAPRVAVAVSTTTPESSVAVTGVATGTEPQTQTANAIDATNGAKHSFWQTLKSFFLGKK